MRLLLTTALLGALALSACSTGEPTAAPSDPITPPSSSTSAPEPTVTASPSPSSSAVTPTPVPASITGLHVAGVQDGAWPDANVPFGSLRLWDSGTGWGQIETTRGRYDWAQLDEALATAEANGMSDVLLVLGTTPAWNAKRITAGDYPAPGAASAPRDLDAWDAYVEAVASRYAGRISAYQIWNEASLSMFWDGSPALMADLTDRAYRIIKQIDPAATVVAASTTVRLSGAFNRFFPRYLAALAERDWPVDAFSAHLYPASRDDTDARAAFIAQVTDALDAAGAPDLPIWDTELNYGLAGPGADNPRQSITGSRARDWVVQTTMDSLALGISRTYWYIWTPEPYPLLGLQLTNDSGAVAGLRIIDQWLVGGELGACNQSGAVTTCEVTKNDVPSVIAWSDAGPTSLTPPAGFTEACDTENACETITGAIDVDETPIRLLP